MIRGWTAPGGPRRVNRVAVLVGWALAVICYARAVSPSDYIWAGWFDQSLYLRAARAWARFDLDPAQHWYLPGYPILGALGAAITPAQPFWLPDLLCLLLSLWLFTRLTAQLVPTWRYAPALGAVVFVATTVLVPSVLKVWAEPWTTTPSVALTFATILLALKFQRAATPGTAALAAAMATAIMLFRPTDAMAVLLVVPCFMAAALLAQRPGMARTARIVLAALAGGALPIAALAVIHGAIYGWSLGGYFTQSAALGFEWRLVPWRWVTLFVAPNPAYSTHLPGGAFGGTGLIVMFPWIVPGLAGMAACLALDRGRHAAHGLIVAVMVVHTLAYLAYRDLHPDGLWHYENFHYFKVLLPLFGLYALLFAAHLVQAGRWRSIGVAVPVLVMLLAWRAEWVRTPDVGARVVSEHGILLPLGLAPVGSGFAVAASGGWEEVYFGTTTLSHAGQTYAVQNIDLKAIPNAGGFILEPLRPLPPIDSLLTVDPAVRLDPSVTPAPLRHSIRFGLPCLARRLPGCAVPSWLPGPALPAGVSMGMEQAAAPYLQTGWSDPEPGGRHIDGPAATLLLRPIGLPAGDMVLAIAARADLPNGGALGITLSAEGAPLGKWTLGSVDDQVLHVRIPRHLLDASGTITIKLALDRPPPTPDRRRATLIIRSLRLDPA